MGKGFHHVDEVESRLIKNMVEEGIPWNTIVKGHEREEVRRDHH